MLTKVRQFAVVKGGAGFPHEDQGALTHPLPFYKVAALGEASVEGYLQDAANTVTEETALALGARVFPAGTVTFAKVGEALKLNRFCLLKERACLDNNMMGLILDAQKAHPRFVRYALGIRDMAELVNPGAVPSVNGSQVGNMLVWLPSPKVQTAIADYLDAKTAAIDALIAKKERLIEELKKYQEAVIAEAVKPREGWKRVPAKRLFKRRVEKNRPEAQLLTASINFGVVPKSSLSFKTNEPLHTDLALYQLVRPGDFVISLATFESGLEFSQCEGIISPAYTVVYPSPGLHAPFYRFYLKSAAFLDEVYPLRKGIRQGQSISYDDFGQILLPVPTAVEQAEIAQRLQAKVESVAALISNVQVTLVELRSYRASLISEAVTGKLQLPN